MEPKLVNEAKRRPGKCLASRDTEGPFIDTGCWTREHDPYLYLSVRWVEEVAKDLLGMVPEKEVEERFAGLEAQLKEQGEKLAALERFEEAVAEYEEARQVVILRNAGPEVPAMGFVEAVPIEATTEAKKEKVSA